MPNYEDDQIQKDKICGECSTHGIKEKFIKNWSERLKSRDKLDNLGVDRRIIFNWMLKKLLCYLEDWIP